ncbi:uncharacterized protein Charon [Drosophila kikkawai]|uniref:Uncharacterized protein Charon n=1 Tax=Drosophila kikkawai TaxID=30033 RepID=A0A6P4HZP7_DROKI|nr:uncharacterized protein LOC108074425 [Drosophila kikkawai]
MKKVLLTKSQHIQAVASADLSSKQAAPVRVIAMPMAQLSTAYMQRKSFQSIYEDIFKLLMRIPDKALQQRVIDAINGHGSVDKTTISHQGKQCSCGAQKVDASTQTETETETRTSQSDTIKNVAMKNEEKPAIKHESVDSKASVTSSEHSPTPPPIASPSQPVKVAKKRGRKRNTCVPQVVKRSAAEMALQERDEKQLTPVVTKRKKQEFNSSANINRPPKATQERRDSDCSDFSLDDHELNRVEDYINNGTSRDKIVQIMADVFKKAQIRSEVGLLPIHDDILRNDNYGVRRQIFACSHANLDINELLTSDGEDCLELALTNETDPEITSLLLAAGCLTDHVYENSNTALHLAVINNINIESIRILMRRVDLNLLLETNDDGYTALHLAVRQNQFLIAEAIFDIIDERDLGKAIYHRATEMPGSGESDEKAFAKYYDRACDRLEANRHKLKNRRLKANVINSTEARAGNTPLFYAVEGEQEHFCYFLLAHLADPDEENLSGYSPKSFHYEYARILRINLKVSRVMDKVTAILNS